ncbi:hypothetical protein PLESTB_001560500 [Pleodorina starrii]|uniref:Uncharacterized protein n=1 Tax=Pleodorina starrii TaxID=330485 RepID=A0A9W6BWS2_9CHLO|nr:hypothetical protein PLESTM_001476700 [Pleodorina starrii]GLC59981.1 hypothetical protein PLESTB_001560500 [Pleodorina starrii]GLC72791.1 hypothetical protein PLESTF_001293500 [Pleodorina starrii]
MGGQKRRRVAAGGRGDSTIAGENTARWGELPREIVAMIASYTCAPVQPFPFTCLVHNTDPDSSAYHRQEDRSFMGPGAQFTVSKGPTQPTPGPMGQPGGSSGNDAGPSAAAGPSTSLAPTGGADANGEAEEEAPGGAIPGTFRPSRMSDTALAMRCVCRLWCEVLGEGVRRVLLPGGGTFVIWASHFPRISHLALGSCTDLLVRSPGGDGAAVGADQAGPGPSSAAAAAAAGAAGGRRRSQRAAGGGGAAAPARAGRRSSGGGAAPAPSKARSLAALASLRNLQVSDTAVHLDLAASCPSLEELVVWAHSQHQQYGTRPGHEAIAFGGNAFAPGGGGRRHGGAGGLQAAVAAGASHVTRRSALDRTLSGLPGLRKLGLSGVDASAARLGAALMALTGLTSLRLYQCRLPTFIGAPERARSGHNSFGRDLVLNLGAKLQDLSLQRCAIRVLPDELLAGLTGLRLLDLSSNMLHALPATVTLMSRLEYLDLQHNTLGSLPEGMAALSRLADLDVSGNYLHRLPADFGQLTALTHLHLGGLHGLDMGLSWPLLTSLTNLHSLGLCDVDLSDDVGAPNPLGGGGDGGGDGGWQGPLHAVVSALGPAGRLRELMLDGCGLDNLPASFSDLTALSHLSLMENFDATGLPNAITSLRGLAVLRLGYLDLSAPLPAGLFELIGLRELDLEQNFLPALSPDISKLSNLQVLNLMDSLDPEAEGPGVIPWASIYKLTRLRHLSISGPEDTPRVARGVGALAGLEWLALHCVTLPGPVMDELCAELRCLIYLDLTACKLGTLPAAITRMHRLTELQLAQNRLTRLPAGFGALTRLVDLGLGGNEQLRSLPADVTSLTRLRSLTWSVRSGFTTPPSAEQLAWMARLPELSLEGSANFAELAKSYNIPWPKRTSYW